MLEDLFTEQNRRLKALISSILAPNRSPPLAKVLGPRLRHRDFDGAVPTEV
jgi:hypothetical protein